MLSVFFIIAMTLVAALFAAYAQFIFKGNIKTFHFRLDHIIELLTQRWTIYGLGVYIVGLVIYLAALKFGELSFVYPIFSISFVFVALVSMYKFEEKLGLYRIIGILFILLGIIFVSLSY